MLGLLGRLLHDSHFVHFESLKNQEKGERVGQYLQSQRVTFPTRLYLLCLHNPVAYFPILSQTIS